jgi:hypothetical protein
MGKKGQNHLPLHEMGAKQLPILALYRTPQRHHWHFTQAFSCNYLQRYMQSWGGTVDFGWRIKPHYLSPIILKQLWNPTPSMLYKQWECEDCLLFRSSKPTQLMVAEVEIRKLKWVWKYGCVMDLVTAGVIPTIPLLSRIQIEFILRHT